MNNHELEERYAKLREQMKKDKLKQDALDKLAKSIEAYYSNDPLLLRRKSQIDVLNNDHGLDYESRLNELITINDDHIKTFSEDRLFTHAYQYTLSIPKHELENKYLLIATLVYHNSRDYFQETILSLSPDFKHQEFINTVDSISNGIHSRIFKCELEELLLQYKLQASDSNDYPLSIDTFGRLLDKLHLADSLQHHFKHLSKEDVARVFIDLTRISLNVTSNTPRSLRKAIWNTKHSVNAETESDAFMKRHNLIN